LRSHLARRGLIFGYQTIDQLRYGRDITNLNRGVSGKDQTLDDIALLSSDKFVDYTILSAALLQTSTAVTDFGIVVSLQPD